MTPEGTAVRRTPARAWAYLAPVVALLVAVVALAWPERPLPLRGERTATPEVREVLTRHGYVAPDERPEELGQVRFGLRQGPRVVVRLYRDARAARELMARYRAEARRAAREVSTGPEGVPVGPTTSAGGTGPLPIDPETGAPIGGEDVYVHEGLSIDELAEGRDCDYFPGDCDMRQTCNATIELHGAWRASPVHPSTREQADARIAKYRARTRELRAQLDSVVGRECAGNAADADGLAAAFRRSSDLDFAVSYVSPREYPPRAYMRLERPETSQQFTHSVQVRAYRDVRTAQTSWKSRVRHERPAPPRPHWPGQPDEELAYHESGGDARVYHVCNLVVEARFDRARFARQPNRTITPAELDQARTQFARAVRQLARSCDGRAAWSEPSDSGLIW